MRAWSAKQRFPVAQWLKQLDELYNESIRIHNKEAKKKKLESLSPGGGESRPMSPYFDHLAPSPGPEQGLMSPRVVTPGAKSALGVSPDLPTPSTPWAGGSLKPNSPRGSVASSVNGNSLYANPAAGNSSVSVDSFAIRAQRDDLASPTPGVESGLTVPRLNVAQHRNSSLLSLPDVVGDRHDLKLQQVDQFFNDTNGEFYAEFEEMLDHLTASNSANELCIETFLKRSEKQWFTRYRDAKLGRYRDYSGSNSPTSSRPTSRNGSKRNDSIVSRGRQRHRSNTPSGLSRSVFESSPPPGGMIDDEFLLGEVVAADCVAGCDEEDGLGGVEEGGLRDAFEAAEGQLR